MVQGHHRFHDASDAGCCLEMPNLRFNGAHGHVAGTFDTGPQPRERGQFRSIAHFGGGAVGFHEFNAGGIVPCLIVGSGNRLNLASLTGRRDALSASVGRAANAPDNAVDLVVIAHGIAQALEHEHAGAFAHDEPVGTSIERRGVRWRKCTDRREFGKGGRVHRPVRSTGEHDVDLSGLEKTARIQDSSHRRSAGRIHGVVWALQVKQVGHSTGNDVGQFSGHRVFIDSRGAFRHRLGKRLHLIVREAVRLGHGTGVMRPHTQIGQVPVFAAQRVGKDNTGSGSVDVVGFTVVACMLNGVSRDGHGPELTRVNLWKRAGRLSPTPPIKLRIADHRPDLGIGIALGMLARSAFFPKMVHRPGPAALGQGSNADLGVQDVLPEGIDVMRIRHQRPETNHRNRFKGPLVNSFARFAVFGCQRHGLTSVHDALRHHRDRIPRIDIDALTGDAGGERTGKPERGACDVILTDVSSERRIGLNMVEDAVKARNTTGGDGPNGA